MSDIPATEGRIMKEVREFLLARWNEDKKIPELIEHFLQDKLPSEVNWEDLLFALVPKVIQKLPHQNLDLALENADMYVYEKLNTYNVTVRGIIWRAVRKYGQCLLSRLGILSIDMNDSGADGIELLAELLKDNSTLTTLNLYSKLL